MVGGKSRGSELKLVDPRGDVWRLGDVVCLVEVVVAEVG